MRKFVIAVLGVALCLGITLLSGTASAKAAASSKENSINAGFAALPGFFDTEATVFFVEYERVFGDKITLFGRFGMLDYTFDDGWYKEDGDGPGLDVGIRFYLLEGAMRSLYIGGSLGLWKTDWTYTDMSWGGTPYFAGAGDSTALKVEFEVGYRFPIPNTPVAVIPTFRTGTYLSIDDSCHTIGGLPCTNESEVGVYGVLGASVGFQF